MPPRIHWYLSILLNSTTGSKVFSSVPFLEMKINVLSMFKLCVLDLFLGQYFEIIGIQIETMNLVINLFYSRES